MIEMIKGTVKSLIEYLEIINEIGLSELDDSIVVYRGHSNNAYKNKPGLFREGNERIRDQESEQLRGIEAMYPDEFSNMTTLDKLVKIQHYGFPTRLLDVTSNPLVALYFATAPHEATPNGAVVIFTIPNDLVKAFDSDIVLCLANLANLSCKQKREIPKELRKCKENWESLKKYIGNDALKGVAYATYEVFGDESYLLSHFPRDLVDAIIKENKENFYNAEIIKQYIYFIRADRPYFECNIEPESLNEILYVKAKQLNARVIAQNGAFLLFGLQDDLSESTSIRCDIIIIDKESKCQLRKELKRIGISKSTLFPDLENYLLDMKETYKTKEETTRNAGE